jgi:hypothetical protein
MTHAQRLLAAALLAAGALPATQADQLEVPAPTATAAVPAMPGRGMHMDVVLRRFGDPAERLAPVGGGLPQHPPITRWVYPGYTVYFENQLVIASVANRAPKAPTP